MLSLNKLYRFNACSAVVMFAMSFSVTGGSFNAFPGKYNARLVSVEAANIIHLSADVYTGFPRNIRVSLPGIAVPVVHSKASACQIALVEKALNFTNEFMSTAIKIEVKDIYMQNTGQQDALTNVYTEKGSLAAKLTAKGFARPSSVDALKPWC